MDKQLDFNFPHLIRNYLADFLCLPIVLSMTLWCVQKIKNNANLILDPLKILVALIYLILQFECFLPLISSRYTADFGDVLSYALGAFYFYIIQKKYFTFKESENGAL